MSRAIIFRMLFFQILIFPYLLNFYLMTLILFKQFGHFGSTQGILTSECTKDHVFELR